MSQFSLDFEANTAWIIWLRTIKYTFWWKHKRKPWNLGQKMKKTLFGVWGSLKTLSPLFTQQDPQVAYEYLPNIREVIKYTALESPRDKAVDFGHLICGWNGKVLYLILTFWWKYISTIWNGAGIVEFISQKRYT